MEGRTMSIILDETLKDESGNVIGKKELINEVIFLGEYSEYITREVTNIDNGKLVINHVLYQSRVDSKSVYEPWELSIDLVQGG